MPSQATYTQHKLSSSVDKIADRYFKPTDLLSTKTTTSLSLRNRLMAGARDAYNALEIKSITLETFYSEISLKYNKSHLRMLLKLIMVFQFLVVSTAPIIFPGNTMSVRFVFLFLLCTLSVYLLTIYPLWTHNAYNYMAAFTCVTIIILDLIDSANKFTPIELMWSIGPRMLIVMYALMPLRVSVSLSTAVLYTIICMILTKNKLHAYDKMSENITELSQFIAFSGSRRIANSTTSIASFLKGQAFLWIACHAMGIFLHIGNQMRRRAAFLHMGENVSMRETARETTSKHTKLIETIMPKCIIDDYLTQKSSETINDMWVYSKYYENVSILFGDIVGFTEMSSNKSAPQVVTILNDLFHRFDTMSNQTNCEKIGTLGDCYYCVSGCPEPTPQHATNVIEMGLGMCRMIKEFNKAFGESVNMRVGVHTGQVHAAILGNSRFHFDVYSSDVLIANMAESSGRPGLVHITEATYDLVKDTYKFNKGEPLAVKREQQMGIQGKVLKDCNLRTYFVQPQTSLFLKRGQASSPAKMPVFVISPKKVITSLDTEEDDGDITSTTDDRTHTSVSSAGISRLDLDMEFIACIKRDPEKLMERFNQPPIWPILLTFVDKEMELSYQSYKSIATSTMTVDSLRIIPLFDSIFLFIYTMCMCMASNYFFPEFHQTHPYVRVLLVIIQVSLLYLCGWRVFALSPRIDGNSMKERILRHLGSQKSSYVVSIAQILVIAFIPFMTKDCGKYGVDYLYECGMGNMYFFCSFAPLLNLNCPAIINIYVAFIIIAFDLVFLLPSMSCSNTFPESLDVKCLHTTRLHDDRPGLAIDTLIIYNFLFNLYFIVLMSRANEKSLRLVAYVNTEMTNSRDDSKRSQTDAVKLLKSILPHHVLQALQVRKKKAVLDVSDLSYAVCVDNVAVIFARVSNFFNSFYREDYKKGIASLNILNKIICIFDDLVDEYEPVDKIKNITDCYMAASGLNTTVRPKSHTQPPSHALMDYVFDMKKALDEFNDNFLIHFKFNITVGYNIGTVTAGIIGDVKPLFDIWGDTVNVASRMYSTADSDTVQVPAEVKEILDDKFDFVPHGKVTVKGKGQMETYYCTGRKLAQPSSTGQQPASVKFGAKLTRSVQQ